MDGNRSMTFAQRLEQARRGDPAMRDRLFQECRDQLGPLAQAQVESWLRAKVDASDLVQQTLFEAHRDFERFQGASEGEWYAWLRRILTHNALDLVRQYHGTAKRQAHREVVLSRRDASSIAGALEPVCPEPSPSQQVIAHDDQLRVAAALAELSADHREVIVLRNLQRLPFDEVARQMGRTRPAVQMLWMRAMKKLQEAVDDEASNVSN
jgi:RNA polymerase sigma-70 factor, ECF subfamily